MGCTAVTFTATDFAVGGIPHEDAVIGKTRWALAAIAGPPRGAVAPRVSTARQGVIGKNPGEQDEPADWLTVNVAPATVSVPDLAQAELEAIVYDTVPFPDPEAPPVIVIHGALLDADQEQPAPVVTVIVPPPAPAEVVAPVGLMAAAPLPAACVTVYVWPAIVSAADRPEHAVFAAADQLTDPFPVPDAPDVTVSHPAALDAVHAHAAPAVTLTEPDPPEAGADPDVAPRL